MVIFESDKASIERIPKFKITSNDGKTLAIISEKGIVPRGYRADMKLFDESSGFKHGLGITGILSKITEYELKERERQSKMDKLEELCKPISDYLRENYNMHSTVVITDDMIKLVQDQMGIPVNHDEENEEATIGSQLAKLVVLSGDLGENPYGSKYEAELAMDNFIVGLVGNRNKELFKSLLTEFNSKTK